MSCPFDRVADVLLGLGARSEVFVSVIDHAVDDVGDVLVGKRIPVLPAGPGRCDQPCATQRLEVLGDGRLGESEDLGEFVYTPIAGGEFVQDLQPARMGQRLEEFCPLAIDRACF